MPKVAKVLNEAQVKALRKSSPGLKAVGGVPGLYLRVAAEYSTQWVLRAVCAPCGGETRHDIGLGNFPLIGLAEAREKARGAHLQMRQGTCVLEARAKVRAEKHAIVVTFGQAATDLHANKAKEFKNDKHAAQWISSLREYAQALWDKSVSDVCRDDVLAVLKPIWETKTETATRVRQRIEQVLAYAAVAGLRSESAENPARWLGGLQMLLPKPTKLKKVKHHAALPWKQVPAFMTELAQRDGNAAQALRFAILTAARSGEVRLATWREIDLDAALWIVPGERMKAGKEHKVPLPASAVALLRELPRAKPEDLLFPSTKGSALSDMALLKVCHRMKVDAVPHGFRSSFKDWAREELGAKYSDEVSELALAHVSDDKTRAAYARGELIELRRELMKEWGEFLSARE